eukprot:819262-Pyramimonas_sp.AAC.1
MDLGVERLAEEELDWLLAEREVDLFEESGGVEGLGACLHAVGVVRKGESSVAAPAVACPVSRPHLRDRALVGPGRGVQLRRRRPALFRRPAAG